MAVKLGEIRAAAERVAASHGLAVVEMEFTGSAKDRILRIFLEKDRAGRAKLKAEVEAALAAGAESPEAPLPERLVEGKLKLEQLSGLTHEDCSAFSRDFGVLLDVEDLVPGAEYTLEASSPGLDRKLHSAEDFERFQGCLVKIQTFEAVKNNRHWQGRLVEISPVPKGEGPGAPISAGERTITPGAPTSVPISAGERTITLDLAAVQQNSKSRKTGVSLVELALRNIDKAQLVPEI